MRNENIDFQKFGLSKGISSMKLDSYRNYISQYLNPTILEGNMNVTQMDIFSRLQMDRILFLGTSVDSDTANIISAQLLWLEQQSNNEIQMYINSPGGSIYDGYQIIDTMEFIKPEVSTTCLGMAASMGAVIFTCGHKGKRFIIPHGRFMIHQPLSGTGGHTQASDIQILANEISFIKEEICHILSENSNLSYDEILKMSDRDCWMTSKEVIKYGFADKIIEK